jgi:hypothetical protein
MKKLCFHYSIKFTEKKRNSTERERLDLLKYSQHDKLFRDRKSIEKLFHRK